MDSKEHDLLFIDESSFHSWLAKGKAWQREDQVIEVPLNKDQHRITVFGAIGTALKNNMFCELYNTTNGENFCKFLPLLKANLRNQYSKRKVYLCIDNHVGHRSKKSLKVMKELDFVPLFLPSYSSYFNSVEHLWALLKQHFKKLLCVQNTHLTYVQFKALVRKTLPLVSEEKAGNICYANRKYLCEQLQKSLE